MPIPVSQILKRIKFYEKLVEVKVETVNVIVPFVVNLIALFIRFSIIYCTRW